MLMCEYCYLLGVVLWSGAMVYLGKHENKCGRKRCTIWFVRWTYWRVAGINSWIFYRARFGEIDIGSYLLYTYLTDCNPVTQETIWQVWMNFLTVSKWLLLSRLLRSRCTFWRLNESRISDNWRENSMAVFSSVVVNAIHEDYCLVTLTPMALEIDHCDLTKRVYVGPVWCVDPQTQLHVADRTSSEGAFDRARHAQTPAEAYGRMIKPGYLSFLSTYGTGVTSHRLKPA
jgi:hypothetical protein